MQYFRLDIVRYVAMADAPALGTAYGGVEGGRIHLPLESAPDLYASRAAIPPSSSAAFALSP